jgi:photosystem II stability/assembly factor-like uncharacterized protein
LVAADGAAGDQFGWSAAIDGSTSILGAYLDDNTRGIDAGSAYIFETTSLVSCSSPITISQSSASFPKTGGSSSITINAGSSCFWSATTDASWITITSARSGTGNAVLNYTVGANVAGVTRKGTINVSGAVLTVNQEAPTNTWAPIFSGAQTLSLARAPSDQNTVYAGTSGLGILKTTDGGATWTTLPNSAGANVKYFSLAVNPTNPNVVFGATVGSIYRSNGNTNGSTVFTLSATFKSLAIDPNNPNTVYAGGTFSSNPLNNNVFKTTNGGTDWVLTGGGGATGLVNLPVFALALDPLDSTIYVGTGVQTGLGFVNALQSTDGGGTYDPAFFNIGDFHTVTFAIDTNNPDVIYAGTSTPTFSPDEILGTTGAGIYKSTNGGLSGSLINNGLTSTRVLAIVIDPTNSNTIYAGTYGGGVFKSTNAGATWSPFNTGLSSSLELGVNGLAIDNTGKRLYVGTTAGVYAYQYSN